jgi:TPR repeat protein
MDANALYEAGMNGILGTDVSRNDVTAVQYFRQSADLGYTPAQDVIGYFFETGTVVPQDNHQALVWYGKAARKGDRLAQWVLGRMYYTGTGEIRDLNEAANWLMKASAQGDAFAQLLLGSVLLERQDFGQRQKAFDKRPNKVCHRRSSNSVFC